MLGTCPSIISCKSESAIRHKVRKLRAKVRALIPNEVCASLERRNHRVQQIQQNRIRLCCTPQSAYKNLASAKHKSLHSANEGWKYGTHKLQSWYSQSQDRISIDTKRLSDLQFEKLKKEQIEQINEDKLYYLGEKNITAYDNFLLIRKSNQKDENQKFNKLNSTQNRSKVDINNHADTSTRKIFEQIERKIFRSNERGKTMFLSKSTHNNFISQSTPIITNDKKRNWRNSTTSLSKWNAQSHHKTKIGDSIKDNRMKEFQQRRQQIQQDERQKRIYQKIKMDMQMAKAASNQRQIKQRQYEKIQVMQNIQKQRHDRAVKKKSILMKKGEIVKFDEELRSIMLKRRNIRDQLRSNSCIFQHPEFPSQSQF